ncbi:MAG TPA: dihydrolipoyl dehydrogenase, partial [Eubacteriaceae bacterium]|nr:dihydrolipoyl dehydrogenase [Eubacteriaceae bacterium]
GEEGEEVPDAPAQPKEAKEEKKESKPSKAAEDSDEYDVVVLGAGPGGYVAAIRAAQLGGKVAIVEKDYFGGTCLNVGCIPTKTLVKSAEILHGIDQGKARGITVGDVNIDMKKVKQNKDQVVKNLTGGIQNLLKSNKVDIFDGLGTVKAGDKVTITDGKDSGKTIAYKNLIVATGSLPVVPPIPGLDLEGIMTSTEILDLDEIPKELV